MTTAAHLARAPGATRPKAVIAPKTKKPVKGMALPPGGDVFARKNYVIGDGDPFTQASRPGSADHERHLSTTSAGAAVYPAGHD